MTSTYICTGDHGGSASGNAYTVTMEGDMDLLKSIPYYPDARVNTQSQHQLVDIGYSVVYNRPKSAIDLDTLFV